MNKEPCRNSLLGMLTNWEKKNRSTPPPIQDVLWLYQAVGPTAGRSPRVITGKYPAVQGVGEICASQADRDGSAASSSSELVSTAGHLLCSSLFTSQSLGHGLKGQVLLGVVSMPATWKGRREAKTNQPTNHHHHTDNKNDQAAHSKKNFHANNTQISYFLELGQHKSLLSIRMWCICSAPTSWQGLPLLLILATRKGHPEFQLCR